MKNFGELVEELFSRIMGAEWAGIVPALALAFARFLRDWLLKKSRQYQIARAKADRSPKKKLISLGPSPDYVQALLDDLMTRQDIWIHKGKSKTEVLLRTIGWGLDFLKGLLHMTWGNLRSTANEKEEKRNRES